jgi:hypothetical protein
MILLNVKKNWEAIMAWSDEPTEGQLRAIHNMLRWKVPHWTLEPAIEWLETTATRKEVSVELKRLRELYMNHSLTEEECFNSEIWEGFVYV